MLISESSQCVTFIQLAAASFKYIWVERLIVDSNFNSVQFKVLHT